MTTKDLNIEEYVEQMALVLGLSIAPEYKPEVIDNFSRIAAIAQLVLEFELPQDVEAAPIYHPTAES